MDRPEGPVTGRRRVKGMRVRLDVDRLVEMYAAGQTIAQIAAYFDTSDPTIYRRLKAAGVTFRRPGILNTREPVTAEQVAELYRQGMSLRMIGERLGISEPTAHRRLKSLGIRARRRARPVLLVDEGWCRQMLDDGHTLDEISGWLGMSPAVLAFSLGLDGAPSDEPPSPA